MKVISCGNDICIKSIGKFKRGDICHDTQFQSGIFHIGFKNSDTYEMTITREELDNFFVSLHDSIFIDLYQETIEKRLFFKPKIISSIEHCFFNFSNFDQVYLERIQSEILIYILEIQDQELLLQFSTDIRYTLNSLIELYKQRHSIDYSMEITKASTVFKEINAYCMPLQIKANEGIAIAKNEMLTPIMDAHKLNMDNAIAKLKELNKYN